MPSVAWDWRFFAVAMVSFDSGRHGRAADQHVALEARDELERIDALLAEVDEVPQQVPSHRPAWKMPSCLAR